MAVFFDLGVVWDYIPPNEWGAIAVRILLGRVFVLIMINLGIERDKLLMFNSRIEVTVER